MTNLSFLILLATTMVLPPDEPTKMGVVKEKRINESSGLAISRTHDDCLWVHNDSGDDPLLYLIAFNGKHEATVEIDDVKAIDWEDMCSFEADGKRWLLIGDIGDNGHSRGKGGKRPCRLILIEEPRLKLKDGKPKKKVKPRAEIEFEYDDGRWNCESLAVDVERGEILLLTKELPFQCGLYRIPLSLKKGKRKATAKRIASPSLPFVTALDVNPDGRVAIVGSMAHAVVFRRSGIQTWADSFGAAGSVLELPSRKQGETLCFDRSGTTIFVNSEGQNQPLWQVTVD